MTRTKTATKSKATIDGVEVTHDTLTGRGDLSLFVRHLRNIQIFQQIDTFFGSMRRRRKGQPITEIFKQLLCFFMDGTSRHLVDFDAPAKDAGYAAVTECEPGRMLSSHAVKLFFCPFWRPRLELFRHLSQRLFLWRLKLQEPDRMVLGMDTLVTDNDEARGGHGVKPASKRVKGIQPLQRTWQNDIIDAVFRRGDPHRHFGERLERMVRHVVAKIPKPYRAEVATIVRMDSGFFDRKLFDVYKNLGIGNICGGKLYEPNKAFVAQGQ